MTKDLGDHLIVTLIVTLTVRTGVRMFPYLFPQSNRRGGLTLGISSPLKILPEPTELKSEIWQVYAGPGRYPDGLVDQV